MMRSPRQMLIVAPRSVLESTPGRRSDISPNPPTPYRGGTRSRDGIVHHRPILCGRQYEPRAHIFPKGGFFPAPIVSRVHPPEDRLTLAQLLLGDADAQLSRRPRRSLSLPDHCKLNDVLPLSGTASPPSPGEGGHVGLQYSAERVRRAALIDATYQCLGAGGDSVREMWLVHDHGQGISSHLNMSRTLSGCN